MAKKKDTKPKPAPQPVNLASFIASASTDREEQFIISGTNTQGKTCREAFSCVPAIEAQAEEILHSKKYPFRHKGDIYRWCVHRGLAQLLDWEPEIHSVMHVVETMNLVTRRSVLELDYSNFFSTLEKGVRGLRLEEATGEIKKLCRELQKSVATMPPGYWRNRYVERFEKEYGTYLKTDASGEIIWPETFGSRSINKEKARLKARAQQENKA